MEKHSRFPLFLNIENKKAVVIGAGEIALRRINTLLKFRLQITVVSPSAKEEIKCLAKEGKIHLVQKEYEKGDIEGAFLAIAATDKREVNHAVGLDAIKIGVFVSVADCKEECSFFFPAIIEDEKTVVAVIGDGNDHKAVAKTASQIREILNPRKEC